MSYVSYGTEEVIRSPHHHHRHHELHRDLGRYADDYAAGDTRAVRLDERGDAGEMIVRQPPGYRRETFLEDDYRPSRSHYDRERYGAAVSRRRAASLGRDRDGRFAGYYSSRHAADPRRSLEAVSGRDVYYEDYGRERRPHHRSPTQNEKLVAGAAGAGIAIAGKEYWDHKKNHPRSPIETTAAGVAGAVAGVEAAKFYERSREHSRGGSRRATVSHDSTRDYSPDRGHERRKSFGEAALAAIGLGGMAYHHSRSRSRSRGRSRSRSRSQSRSGSRSGGHQHRRGSSATRGHSKMEQAVKAALAAAVAEAVASRHSSGGLMTGERGLKIAKAAIAAGGLEAVVDDDPEHHTKRNIAEAVIGSLAGQRILDRRLSRSGSRHRRGSSSGGALGDLAKGGLAAAAGKALMDFRNRSKSRGRSRSRSRDSSSGFGDRRDRDHDEGRSRSRPSLHRQGTGHPRGERGYSSDRGGGGNSGGSGDEMSATDEEGKRRKLRGKELLQAGVATVATLHAAHGIYARMEASGRRHEARKKGEIPQEENRREKAKAQAQDLASLGLAIYSAHGVMKNWEAMASRHGERREFDRQKARRRRQRGKQQRSQRSDSRSSSRSGSSGGSSRRADGSPRLDPPDHRYYDDDDGHYDGPVYHDGNPYAAGGLGPSSSLPPPPPPHSDERH
ncbi:hypothetical protein GP486_007585 [Trichoglossum hirsutum]|uniref:DUF3824 domain-containing protein n=1 Tax=Trichoglossum hirsutum TaxID=265104 RepID=A0A9P8L4S1_9PEZI|nr:hypothetical protein GP486_007585 [Trichoglossum hirsutum]